MALKSRADAERFLVERHKGALVTLKRSDGRPQVSNIMYALIDGRVRISVTDTRSKVANLRHDLKGQPLRDERGLLDLCGGGGDGRTQPCRRRAGR